MEDETDAKKNKTIVDTSSPSPSSSSSSSSSCECRTVSGERLQCGAAVSGAAGRVVNGSDSAAGDHPWAVQIRTKYGKVR